MSDYDSYDTIEIESSKTMEQPTAQHGTKYIAVIPFLYILFLITVFGNLLVFLAILTHQHLRKSRAKRFLLNLAVADMCVGFFVMLPAIHVFEANGIWDLGWKSCLVWVTLDVGFSSASIYSLIGVSIDRFYALYFPIRYFNNRKNVLTTNLLMLMAWVMAVIVASPMYITANGFSNWVPSVKNNSKHECIPPVDPDSKGYVLYASTLAFMIPSTILIFVVVLFTYRMRQRLDLKIERAREAAVEFVSEITETHKRITLKSSTSTRFQKSDSNVEPSNSSANNQEEAEAMKAVERTDKDTLTRQKHRTISKRQAKTDHKLKKVIREQTVITLMMGSIVITFLVCWTPFIVMFTSFPFEPEFWTERPIWIQIITWIGYTNSSLNPGIYAIMNPDMRAAMLNVIKLKKLRKFWNKR